MSIGLVDGLVLAIKSLVKRAGVIGVFGGVALEHRQRRKYSGLCMPWPL